MSVVEPLLEAGRARAILTLAALLVFCVMYGLANAGYAFAHFFLGGGASLLSHIPVVGGFLGGSIRKLEQRAAHYFGNQARYYSAKIGWAWYVWATTVRSTAAEIEGLSVTTYHALSWFQKHYVPFAIGVATAPIVKAQAVTAATTVDDRRARIVAAAAVAQASRLPYWKWRTWVDHQFGQVIPGEIAVVGAEVGTLGNRVAADAARLSRLNKILAALGLASLVGVGLNRLGLGHLRCRNNRRFGKALCGLPLGLLEGLLGGAVDLLIVLDVCRLARFATRAAVLFEPVLRELVVVVDAALCGGTREAPPALAVNGQPWPSPATALPL